MDGETTVDAATVVPEVETKQDVPAKEKRPKAKNEHTVLEAAVAILTEAGIPLGCTEMASLAKTKGLWTTDKKTPGITFNATINNHIRKVGDKSLIVKAQDGEGKELRGKYTLRK